MATLCPPCTSRQPAAHVYYGATRSLCSTCGRSLDAKIQFEADRVVFDKYCPAHGHERRVVSSSVGWYLDALSFLAPSTPPTGPLAPARDGCPFDCGPCVSHLQQLEAPPAEPVLAIGEAEIGEVGSHFDRLLADGDVHVLEVNLTGGAVGIPEVHAALREHSGGRIEASDFVPSPRAHPHCFSLLPVLVADEGGFVPFARLIGREATFDWLSGEARLAGELRGDEEIAGAVRRGLAAVRASAPASGGADDTRSPGSLRATTLRWKAVRVHAQMTAGTFDVGRVMRCSVGTPREDGSLVPVCVRSVVRPSREPGPKERRVLPTIR